MKRLISCIAFILCLLMCVSSFAENSLINISEIKPVQSVDETTGKINQYIRISGTTDESLYNGIVTVGIVEENLDSGEVQNYEILKQLIVDENGSFRADIPFSTGGNFVVRVGGQGIDTPYENPITTISTDVINNFMQGIKSEYDKSDLNAELLKNGEALGFDMAIFNRLSSSKQEEICQNVLDTAKDETIEKIKEVFDESCAVVAVSKQKDDSIVLGAIKHYESLYGFGDESEYKMFSEGDDDLRSYVAKSLGENEYDDAEEIRTALCEYTALYDIYDVKVVSKMIDKIDAHSSFIDADVYEEFSDLSVSKKTNVVSYLNKNKVKTMAEFNKKLDYVITNYKELYPSSSDKGGSSSGGSSSGGKGSTIVNLPLAPEPVLPSVDNATVTTAFDDLDDYKWAEDAILYLLDKKIVNGRAVGKFCPGENVTRAEFVKMFMLACEVGQNSGASSFSDVPSSHWAYEYVSIASSNGLVNGISQTEFGADMHITREDMATLGYRIMVYFGDITGKQNVEEVFTDSASFSDYSKNGIMMLAKHGFINGYPDGSFKPKNSVTRAEAAQFIYNFIKGR
ncbi:MAG: S-layer homology domain-containing protein [Clostridia bacterium]|nr:S-layer homology domain-containing protein [Clostridia bacterium]